MTYTYYLQDDSTKSVRRYPEGNQAGERWSREKKLWDSECCDRRSCELTRDRILTEAEAYKLTT